MLIHKISLSNFKSFEDVEVVLGRANIFVGANASGKSNFIQSLKFVKDIKAYGIENAISRQGGVEYFRNFQLKDRKNSTISIEFQPNSGTIIRETPSETLLALEFLNVTYSIEIGFRSKSKYSIVKEEIRYNTKVKELFIKNISSRGAANEDLHNNSNKSLGEYNFVLSFKNGEVKFESGISESKVSLTLHDNTKIELDSQDISPIPIRIDILKQKGNIQTQKTLIEQYPFILPPDLLEFSVYDFDLKKSKEATSITGKVELEENGENLAIVIKNILEDKEKARRFSNLLSDILPFIKDFEIEKFYDKSLLFKVKESYYMNSRIPSSLLSDGTISVTSIVTALFFEDKSLGVFEEPEQGVHPALIAKLMQYFYDASSKRQIIITTHSPEILKHTKLNDLFLVARSGSGFTMIDKPVEKEMVKAFLSNELGIDQLFTQNLLDA